MLDSTRFPTCSSDAAQSEAQGTSLPPQERPPLQPANRAMRFLMLFSPFSLPTFFTPLYHPRLERGSRGSLHRVTQFAVSFFTFFTLLTFFTSSLAETFVSGEVSGVWDVDGSPYLVTDTLTVPAGDTLLVEPGVTITFLDQTDSTRTPVYVYGRLDIQGVEGDSVFINSEGAAFEGIFLLGDWVNRYINVKYCATDSAYDFLNTSGLGTGVTLCHSRIHALRFFLDCSLDIADTVEYCTLIEAPGGSAYGIVRIRNGAFRHNQCATSLVEITITSEVSVPVEYNEVFILEFDFYSHIDTPLEVNNNTINAIIDGDAFSPGAGNYYIHDNIIYNEQYARSICISNGNDAVIERNNIGNIDCRYMDGDVEIFNNTITGLHDSYLDYAIEIRECNASIHDNLIRMGGTGIGLSASPGSDVYNNTIHFDNYGIRMVNTTLGDIVNNIFQGDGQGNGIQSVNGSLADETAYNCFWNVTEAISGYEMDETNLIADPFLAGGDPFDYHLQANSPCIDVGDPDSPDDPDGTRADIGCYYYDHTIDNPPVQTIPEEVFAQTGQLLRIQIIAIDDNGPFIFTLPDLPDWLTEEDELDWVSDTTVVSGTVPADAEDFSFTVIVEDGEGQTDTSLVTVDVDQRTLLSGEISGVLHVEDSPFYVVQDIIVPEGDSLVIEPGCELQFRYVEDEEQRLSLLCQGTLIAEGTEEDSIKFTMSTEESVLRGWNRIRIDGVDAYASFRFILVHNASFGLQVANEAIANIMHYYSSTSRISIAGALALIDSSYLTTYDNYGYTMIEITNNANASVTNCLLEDLSIPPVSKAFAIGTGNISIEKNTITGTSGATVEWNASPVFAQNIFYKCGLYRTFVIANYARMNVFNNLFIGTYIDSTIAIQTASITDTIANNMFSNFQLCIYLRNWEDDDETSPVIRNNVFINSHTGIHSDLSQDRTYHTEYNTFWEVDTPVIDCPFDQTNLVVDPLFADTSYHLYDNSPLIDAGYPENDWFDTDSTRSDIGLWGGPYGTSYEYPVWVRESCEELPSEFRLSSPYPNPFNSVQHIQVALPCRCSLTLRLYNVLGRQVFARHTPTLDAGNHIVSYSANHLSSGVYFLEVTAGKEVQRARVLLLK